VKGINHNSKIIPIYIFTLLCLICCSTKNTTGSKIGKVIIPILPKGNEALVFCKKKKFNTDFCFLADMSIHSGRKRLFLWNFKTNKIDSKYMVGHGCGDESWGEDDTKDSPTFSNTVDSHRSSLGKYKISERGFSSWGINIKYLMHGLEESNSNAQKRIVVFHSWEKMPQNEVFPAGSPEGWGCPTVANEDMKNIDKKLKNSTKPVLLWMYAD
jgi:L,D-transpeptidase catalytic domain